MAWHCTFAPLAASATASAAAAVAASAEDAQKKHAGEETTDNLIIFKNCFEFKRLNK